MNRYIDAIEKTLLNIHKYKLSDDILNLTGFSGIRTRIFYNNLIECLKDDVRYLEIGVWYGSTFASALYANKLDKVLAIDNWSEFNGDKKYFTDNILNTCGNVKYDFIEGDCFDNNIIEQCKQKGPFNIYLYDGEHSSESHAKALELYKDCLDDIFIYICDDWNWDKVQIGTNNAIEKDYEMLYSKQYFTNYGDEIERKTSWWNGILIAILKKK
jgi:hypothetical protein